MPGRFLAVFVAAPLVIAACGDDGGSRQTGSGANTFGSGESSSGGTDSSTSATGSGSSSDSGSASMTMGSGPVFDLGQQPDVGMNEECEAPDVLIVLDRTMSMHRRPDSTIPNDDMMGWMESRWWLAIEAVETFTSQYENSVRFGLELFPQDPGNDSCVTLSERISGTTATNPDCQAGELAVAPALGTAMAIDSAIEPLSTLLCTSTPIGGAIQTAGPILSMTAAPGKEQVVVLVTDGGETCSGGPVARIQELVAMSGARVYVVAFGDSAVTDDHARLNRMACAGQTAAGFPGPCVDEGNGNYTASDPDGATLYIAAEDGVALSEAFDELAGTLCCGTACPPG